MSTRLLTMLAGALLATPAMAQDGADSQRLLDAIELPGKAETVRAAGMSASEVSEALSAAKANGLGATGALGLLGASSAVGDAFRGSFGAYVSEQLAAGKRGQDLADAILAETTTRRGGAEAAPADVAGGKRADPPPHDRRAAAAAADGKTEVRPASGHDRRAAAAAADNKAAATPEPASGHDRRAAAAERRATEATPAPDANKTKGGK